MGSGFAKAGDEPEHGQGYHRARVLQIPRVWVDRERTGHDPAIANAVLTDLTFFPETLESLSASG